MQVAEVPIREESIKLGQFIKLASLVATGGEAKEAIAAGAVTVNEQQEARRGRTLVSGDVVCVGGRCARVIAAGAAPEDDYFDEATADDDFDPEKWRNL
ncbi:RNA-binding S4 domain-containing protein [Corynebacterium sp. zg-331]|uniref:RNA-binding S4 domain-containing protein n=1 Tax=unclassified Corynebacterium TaxID=2624378 RepID=UPI00128E5EF5|nr:MULTISPECIES: RNA-binding S4 domain-containing protein [unclassified Corynebacterium]MBC3186648.1 RNA-binding S4 domain-containing protein [Corynebacterium sp. zg-331]MPV53132.1 RNA-binding protein [Corynebacterium sp. zg331]